MVVPFCNLQCLDLSCFLEDNDALFTQTNARLCVSETRAAMWPHHSWPVKVSGFTQNAQLADD